MTAWAQTTIGRALVFAAPEIERHHIFFEMIPALARLNRFYGQTELPYSVAQHSVLMAEAAEDETSDPELAAFCLLHDAHEAYFGDWPSPAVTAVAERMVADAVATGATEVQAASLGARFKDALRGVKRDLDRSIFRAASLDPERYLARQAEVLLYDLRALHTERAQLMRTRPRPWASDITHPGLKPLRPRKGRIKPWPWPEAEDRFKEAYSRLCPVVPPARRSLLQSS